jgi:hypothetical protein
LPEPSYSRTWWSSTELIIGVLAILGGHVWAFFATLAKRDDHQIFHYLDFSQLWRLTFENLADTRRALWIGCWGGVAVLCAVFLVGGIPVLWKGLPNRMAVRATRGSETAFDFSGNGPNSSRREERELTGRDRDLDDASQENRFTELCSVIGYIQEDNGSITGLVLAIPRDDGLHYAGVVKAAADEESIAKWEKGIGKVTDPGLFRLDSPVEGLTEARVRGFGLGNKVTWVEPKISCFVDYTEASEEGVLRDPVFKSW